jgi:hypothetical protein
MVVISFRPTTVEELKSPHDPSAAISVICGFVSPDSEPGLPPVAVM